MLDQNLSESWIPNRPCASAWLNGYSLLVPEGEKSVIRTVTKYKKELSGKLKIDVERLIREESEHAVDHHGLPELYEAEGVKVKSFIKWYKRICYSKLESMLSNAMALSCASAIEHINVTIAKHAIDASLFSGYESSFKDLHQKHFDEEIGHRSVVFDVYQYCEGSYVYRMLGYVTVFISFIGFLMLGFAFMLFQQKESGFLGRCKDAIRLFCGRNGLVIQLFKASLEYSKPSFHPSKKDFSQGQQREKLEVIEREDGFEGMFNRHERKVKTYKEKNAFFFQKIECYEDPYLVIDGKRLLNFCTYSYLGLANDSQIKLASQNALQEYGNGTHGVRLLGGNLALHEELEDRLAKFSGCEAALMYSSGYMTNVSTISSLLSKGDVVFSDSLNHASIVDGTRLSGAKVVRFSHQNLNELSEKLLALPPEKKKLIVVDGVYSMDGDIAPLDKLLEIRDRYKNTLLMVDEAHSLGVLGKTGRGIEEHYGVSGEIDLKMGTLSKTIPGVGGFIAAKQTVINFLRYNSRGFIFSAALPPSVVGGAIKAIEILESEGEMRRNQLNENIKYFTYHLKEMGYEIGPTESAVIPVMLYSEKEAFSLAKYCFENGVYAMPVIFPAVGRGKERLRMNLTSLHQKEHLDRALEVMRHYKLHLFGNKAAV